MTIKSEKQSDMRLNKTDSTDCGVAGCMFVCVHMCLHVFNGSAEHERGKHY